MNKHFLLHSQCLTLSLSTSATSTHVLGYLLECSSFGNSSLTTTLRLVGSLAGLDLLQGSISLCGSEGVLLSSLLLDVLQRGSNNGPLDLVSSATALLGDSISNPLLVKTTPCLGPHKLGSLFPLKCKTVGLGGAEPDGLSVTADHKLSISRINPELGESANFSCNTREKRHQ
jgi:hypothetical protein